MIDITDFDDDTVVTCKWEEFVSANEDELELKAIESTLDQNEPYHIGGGALTHYVITKKKSEVK